MFLFSVLIITALGCSDPELRRENKTVVLKFNDQNSENSKNIHDETIGVEAEIVFDHEQDRYVLKSPYLQEISAINIETGELIYGYSYIESSGSDKKIEGIKRGYYGFDVEFFYYGTLYEGDNGQDIFVPADLTTQLMGFPPVCPGENEAFA